MSQVSVKKSTKRKRGFGRLYKRGKDGKELSPSSRIHGNYYLEYFLNGKRIRRRLTSDDGSSITKLQDAEQARMQKMAPLLARDKLEKIKAIEARVKESELELQMAVPTKNSVHLES